MWVIDEGLKPGETMVVLKAFRLLVNRSANWAEWNPELITLEFGLPILSANYMDSALEGVGFGGTTRKVPEKFV